MTSNSSEALLKKLYLELLDARQQIADAEPKPCREMAIVGAACRFPGNVNSLESYWSLLTSGKDPIGPIPETRWNHQHFFDPQPNTLGKTYARESGFIDDVYHFDPGFFEVSPREAAEMDPQQRILLELSWEAINHAGQDLVAMKGSNTGVFVGMSTDDYAGLTLHSGNHQTIDAYNSLGTARSVAAGRIAYTWGFHGPVIQMDTACSSSLVALHQACNSIANGDCDQALVAGINLMLSSEMHIACSQLHALSPTNRCQVFDDNADGYVRSEGAGCVLVKPLNKALAAGDRILGVIKSSAINHDGKSNGLTAPNGRAQKQLIETALQRVGLSAEQVGYVETHGTGTRLGDPIEVQSISEALQRQHAVHPESAPLLLGSVKSNIGHLEAAAGMASLLKALLIQQHKMIPANLHFNQPNRQIPWQQLNVKVVDTTQAWPVTQKSNLIGINAFGLSGTNVHVIVGPAPLAAAASATMHNTRDAQVLTLAGKDRQSLDEQLHNALHKCQNLEHLEFDRWCSAHAIHNSHFHYRKALVAANPQELKQQIEQALNRNTSMQRAETLCFVFTGQGAQYAGMGYEIAQQFPQFKTEMENISASFETVFGYSLEQLWWGELSKQLNQTQFTQPALFAFEYCLAKTLMAWGVKPDLCLGHSVGEYVALCLSGMLPLDTALQCLALRATSMANCDVAGTMLAILGGPEVVSQAIAACGLDNADSGLGIAAFNSPNSTVISGNETAVLTVMDYLIEQDIRCVQLDVSHAFHSPLMASAATKIRQELPAIQARESTIGVISNITSEYLQAHQLTTEYLANHIMQPVNFSRSIEYAAQQGANVFLEIGPKSTLTQVMGQILTDDKSKAIAALKHHDKPVHALLQCLGQLYEMGAPIHWRSVLGGQNLQDIERLPYPFKRQHLWTKSTKVLTPSGASISAPNTEPEITVAIATIKETPTSQATVVSASSHQAPDVHRIVMEILARELQMDADSIDPTTPFLELGLDSMMAVEIEDDLSEALGLSLPSTLLFDAPSAHQLIELLCQHLAINDNAAPEPKATVTKSATHQLLDSIRQLDDSELDRLLSA